MIAKTSPEITFPHPPTHLLAYVVDIVPCVSCNLARSLSFSTLREPPGPRPMTLQKTRYGAVGLPMPGDQRHFRHDGNLLLSIEEVFALSVTLSWWVGPSVSQRQRGRLSKRKLQIYVFVCNSAFAPRLFVRGRTAGARVRACPCRRIWNAVGTASLASIYVYSSPSFLPPSLPATVPRRPSPGHYRVHQD